MVRSSPNGKSELGQQFLLLRAYRPPATPQASSLVCKAVLRAIHDHSGNGRSCTASLRTLADESCASPRSVRYALESMTESGVLERHRRPGITDGYAINFDQIAGGTPAPDVGVGVAKVATVDENSTSEVWQRLPGGVATDALGVATDALGVAKVATETVETVETEYKPTSDDSPSSGKKYNYENSDLATAEWMLDLIQQTVDPGAKATAGLKKWAHDIRLIRERDKRTDAQIRELFRLANGDTFWRSNILCPSKLRKQWTTLTGKFKPVAANAGVTYQDPNQEQGSAGTIGVF